MMRLLMRLIVPVVLTSLVLVAAACTRSKLQRDMLGDATWETTSGEEIPWDPIEQQPDYDPDWEREHAPMPGEVPSSAIPDEFPRKKSGVIERHELVEVLDEGLGRYLQNIEMEPAFDRGTFVGFRIVHLFPGDLTYASLDLRPGDVVTSVNGRSIARPEQAASVWDDLRSAEELVVDYRRGSTDHVLRFVIVDAG